ncbi:MAG TPA: DUF4157 domain-containing protein, partial [Haliangium sp.]|nr:DUF4157 domain-containing protein [Haliangium sp.]
MSHERGFRGQQDGQTRPFDWYTPARQHGVPWKLAQALYERAVQQAHALGSPAAQAQEIYLALLANARQDPRRPAPGKVTRTMRLQAERAGERQLVTSSRSTGQPIAPGKVASTSRLTRHGRARHDQDRSSEIDGQRAHVEMMKEVFERSRGAPLPGAVRGRLEQALEADLSGVRVHTGATSNEAARELDAVAFTIGQDIHFADGSFDPGSARGEALLAHEVAHTVQQRGAARVQGDEAPAVSAPGDAHEVEAGRFSKQFLQHRMSRVAGARPTRVASGMVGRAMIHRALADDALPAPAPSEQPDGEAPASPQNDEAAPAAAAAPGVAAPGRGTSQATATPAVEDGPRATGGGAPAEVGEAAASKEQGAGAPAASKEQGTGTPVPPQAAGGAEATAGPGDAVVHGEEDARARDARDDGAPALGPVPMQPTDEAGPTEGVLGQAAARIRASSRAQKLAFQQEMQEQRAGLQQGAEAQARQMEATGKAKLASLLASIQAQEAELGSTFSTARASLGQKVAAQKVQARADGARALAALAAAITEKKRAAITAADGEAKLAEGAGRREAQRARQSAASTIASVNSARSSASGSYSSSKEEVRKAVDDALAKGAREIGEDVRNKSDDLARAAKDGADKAARAIRDAGKKIADGMQAKSGDAEKAIREGTRATVERIDATGKEASQQLDTLERKAVAGLSAARNRVRPAIQGATKAAVRRLRSAARQGLASLAQAEKAALGDFGRATRSALAKLKSAPTGDDVDPAAVEEFVSGTTHGLADMRVQGMAAIGEQVSAARAGIAQVAGSFGGSLAGATAQVTSLIAQAAAELTRAASLPATVDTQCAETRKTAQETYDTSIQTFREKAQKPIDEGKKGWSEQRTRYEGEIKGKVDELIAGNQKVAAEAPGKFAQTARDAAAKADRSLLSKIWGGIKQGLKAFWEGLKWFLLAFVVVFVIAAIALAFLAGGLTLAVLAAAAAAALVIVGVAFLVVGLIQALRHRFSQAWDVLGNRPWYQKLLIVTLCSPYFIAVAVGDVLGVTPILEGIFGYDAITGEELSTEERWKRATVGALTIITLFMIRRAGKALGSPRIPGRPGERPPGPAERPPGPAERPPGPAERPPEPAEPQPEPAEPQPEPVEPRPPRTMAERFQALKDSGLLEGDRSRLDKLQAEAEAGDPGALGELQALERWVAEGRRVEILEEVQNADRTNPDYRVDGEVTEVKTRVDVLDERYIKDRIREANRQVRESRLEGAESGSVEVQLNGEAARAPLDAIEQQVKGQFNAQRSLNLRRVAVYRNGELAGEWIRAQDGSVHRS